MIHSLITLVRKIYDVKALISWGGISLISLILFAETGLFFGFFLPGDSLLVTAGIFAKTGELSISWLLLSASIAAILGDQIGYGIGLKAGHSLFQKEDSLFFKKKHLRRAHDFYAQYGAKTIVLARFIPIVRTFAPAVAGIAEMPYSRFVAYNIIGGLLWILAMAGGGYSLAGLIPDIGQRIHLVILVVIFVSLLPGLFEFWRAQKVPRQNNP
jgi:membrane-associated protein